MLMEHFHALVDTVQHNCHITDARHARRMTMCTYLLEMQQYYRWENEIPYSESLQKSDVGAWLSDRERFWNEVEDLPYSSLCVGAEKWDPFEAEAINHLLVPEGYIYGAGYGRFGKPHFFLGKLSRKETRGNYTILVSGCEYARDLIAPPAALQKNTIFLRRDAVFRMVWEKQGLWKGKGSSSCGELDVLEDLIEKECEAVILHELGEGMAGELLGGKWEEKLFAAPVKAEVVMRAVRDLLADCLSTLPSLIARKEECSLHFYFENLSGMRRDLFPLFVSAYRQWRASGDMGALEAAVGRGREHWLQVGSELLDLPEEKLVAGSAPFRL